jgi:hypothetical protein
MYGQKHDPDNQDDVDESRCNVKRKKSQQPKNDQNCCEYPKHVFNSFYRKVSANQKPASYVQHGHLLLLCFVPPLMMLPDKNSNICSV